MRRIRLTAIRTLEPGDEIKPGDFRRGYLRSLHNRRTVGAKGSAWVDWRLARLAGLSSQEAAEAVDEKRVAESDADRAIREAAIAAAGGALKSATSVDGEAGVDQGADTETVDVDAVAAAQAAAEAGTTIEPVGEADVHVDLEAGDGKADELEGLGD